MSAKFTRPNKRGFFGSQPIEFFLLFAIMLTLVALFFNTIVFAQNDGLGAVDLSGMKTSDIESLYPMSPQAEAAIVHPLLDRPIIVDGVRYEGKEISLFNGQRLYFVIGKDGNLYAFTTAEGFENFQAEYSAELSPLSSGPESTFFADWWYSGASIYLYRGDGYTNLALIAFDNMISSAKVSISVSWALLYDYFSFQGDCLAIPGGTDLVELFPWGWNDRASSVRVE